MRLAVDSYLLPSSKSRDTKTRTKIKNPAPISFRYKVLPPRIRGHLPAPIINGGEDNFSKRPNLQLSRARDLDLDLGLGHTAYRHASLVDLYLHAKFH